MPTIIVVFIGAGTLAGFDILRKQWRYICAVVRLRYAKLVQRQRIAKAKTTIANAGTLPTYELLLAKSRFDRRITAPPDHPSTMWLLDQQLVERIASLSTRRLQPFEITETTWRALIEMEDFIALFPSQMRGTWDMPMPEDRLRRHIPDQYL